MALDSGYWETSEEYMSTDKIAALLVELYADYMSSCGSNEDYAKAVGIAIRMLTD